MLSMKLGSNIHNNEVLLSTKGSGLCACRAPYVLNISSPAAADVWAATAAALAAASLQLKTTHPDLSAEALSLAKVLYAEAVAARPQPNVTHCRLVACEAWGPPQQGDVPAQLLWQGFPSTTALDDMAWAAAWLHTATGAAEAVDNCLWTLMLLSEVCLALAIC
jgi:hypothetical protein